MARERGAELYKTPSQTCHAVLDRHQDQVDFIPIVLNKLDVIKTDPEMAQNFVDRTFIPVDEDIDENENVPTTLLIGDTLVEVWFKSIFSALIPGAIEEFSGDRNRIDKANRKGLSVYKGRPLNGIWATAPYLHNGSIPNMIELLKPENKRVNRFCVGSRDFDPEKLGFEYELDANGGCGGDFLFDTSIIGNSNKGHSGPQYGTGQLNDLQISYIVEFLKAEYKE